MPILRAAALCLLLAAALPAGETAPRLVSLAPSLTEMVFELGGGKLLVGVTSQCRYPPAAQAIAKIGGYQNPSYEAILSLRPDLVLALREHSPSFPVLDALGIRYEVFDHRSLDGVLDSMTRLGEICGTPEKAAAERRKLAAALTPPELPAGVPRPRMLVIFGRAAGSDTIADAWVVGRDGLYDKILAAAGCANAYAGNLPYPRLSGEGVAALDPDIIVELIDPGSGDMGFESQAERRRDWEALANLRALREGRLVFVAGDYVFVPGPRLAKLAEALREAIRGAGLAVGGVGRVSSFPVSQAAQ